MKSAKVALTLCCGRLRLPIFLHHSYRHLFVSNALEAGIDFTTIASWLGLRNRGASLAKPHAPLRADHSFEMAKRMTFDAGNRAAQPKQK